MSYVLCDTEIAKWAAVNPETGLCDETKLTPKEAHVRLVQYAFGGENPTILDLYTEDGRAGLQKVKELARKYQFIFHNAMFDIKWLRTLGVEIPYWEDTRLMSKTMSLGLGLSHHLDAVITRVVGYNPYDNLGDSSNKRDLQLSDWSAPVLTPEQLRYALTDVGPEYNETFLSLFTEINKRDYYKRCYELDKQILPIVDKMTDDGLKFNVPAWKEYIGHKKDELIVLEDQIDTFIDEWTQRLFPERFMITLRRRKPEEGRPAKFKKDGTLLREETPAETVGTLAAIQPKPQLTPRKKLHEWMLKHEKGDYRVGYLVREELGLGQGDPFNPSSATQMRELVNSLLKLNQKETSFDKKEVKELREVALKKGRQDVAEFLDAHLKAQANRKLISTYGESYWSCADENGYIHSRVDILGADTGRWSSSSPNIQNFPKDMQKKFFTMEPDEAMLWFDYTAEEAALLLKISGEEEYYQKFRNGLDLHAMSLSAINGMKYEQLVQRDENTGRDKILPQYEEARAAAKVLTFSIPYGAKGKKVAEIMGTSIPKGKQIVENYWKTYSKLKKFQDNQWYLAVHGGFVSDIYFGRRRNFKLSAEDEQRVKNGEGYEYVFSKYQPLVYNYAIQSLGSTILRRAVKQLAEGIQEHPEYGMVFRMAIHDSIVCTVKEEYAEQAAGLLKDAMEQAASRCIRGIHIPAEPKIIRHGDAHE